jgi:hypothetical protein
MVEIETLTVYPKATVETRMVDLLIGALGTSGAELWLVSPWITDFEISLRERGPLVPHFGASVETIRLSALVGLLQETNRFSIVIRPPHVLMGRGDLARLAEILGTRTSLALLAEDPAVRAALGVLEREAERVTGAIMSHGDTLRFIRAVTHMPNVELSFNPNLHAKELSTARAVLVGSAIFTWSGMNRNDELSIIFSEESTVAQLRAVAAGFASRWFVTPAAGYAVRKALPAAEAAAFDELLVSPLASHELRRFLQHCAEL